MGDFLRIPAEKLSRLADMQRKQELVICFTSLQRTGGALKLLKLNRRNLELLLLTKLSTVFEIFNEEQDAINSFFPDRAIKRFDILSFVQQKENG